MIKLSGSVCIEAPADEVWACLARLVDIQLWAEAVVQARCEGPLSQGVGAERTCDLRGGITTKERWLAWDEAAPSPTRAWVYRSLRARKTNGPFTRKTKR